MARKQIDVVALKEMIKSEFLFRDLAAFDPLQRFSWGWVPSLGHSGGLLLGCNNDVCDVVSWELGAFFIFAMIKHRVTLATWAIVCAYGQQITPVQLIS